MIGDVKKQTIKRRTGRPLTGDRPLFLALRFKEQIKDIKNLRRLCDDSRTKENFLVTFVCLLLDVGKSKSITFLD